MAKDKKAAKAKGNAGSKPKGPRKSGKYKTVKSSQGEVKAAPAKKKAEKAIGPVCSLTVDCRFAKTRKADGQKERRYCSVGIIEKGHCNYAKWGKKMRVSDFSANV